MTFQTVEQLQAQIASLTAENEHLRGIIDILYNLIRDIPRILLQPKEGNQ